MCIRDSIPRAEIAGIGQQRFGLAQFFRQGVDLAEHRFELLLVVRGLNNIGGNHQKAALRHRSLRVVALLEAAAGYRHDARLFVGEIDLIGQQRPPTQGPLLTDQINLTDEESRIMPVAGGGFEQCYNAQAAVAEGSLLVVAIDVVQASNDKQQLEPMLGKIDALPEELGEAETLLADTGYFSAGNVAACEAAAIEPLIAMGRQPHHPPLAERFADTPPAPENPTPVEAMAVSYTHLTLPTILRV